jgi:hypothetical protein
VFLLAITGAAAQRGARNVPRLRPVSSESGRLPAKPDAGNNLPDTFVLFDMLQFLSCLILLCGPALAAPAEDINTQIAQLIIGSSTLDDVVRIFGPPSRYAWGNTVFTRDKLPEIYLADCGKVSLLMRAGKVMEVRPQDPAYKLLGKAGIGSTAEEFFAAVGQPLRTERTGTFSRPADHGVLYQEMEGRPGTSYFERLDLGFRAFLRDGKVSAIMLVPRQKPRPLVPRFDPESKDAFQIDLRGKDLSKADLAASAADLWYATFDTGTHWPAALPDGFDAARVMDTARSPGLGVRQLHRQGITGKGVILAMIDSPLRRNHVEFGDRIRFYEEMNLPEGNRPHMHGNAALSIAAGKTVGVAPGADLYYIANHPGDTDGVNFKYLAAALRRMVKVNEGLPDGKKIRVVAMQIGWAPSQPGYDEMTAAANAAKAAGMLVVSSSIEEVHGLKFHGLGRQPLADPDAHASYEPGLWWASRFTGAPDRLLVPMDSRTTAGPGGPEEYVFYRQGGWSWSIPYIAGLYALAAQVDPAITPERFWATAMKSGRTVYWKGRPLGPIADPEALVRALHPK